MSSGQRKGTIQNQWVKRLYAWLADDHEGRVCKGISEEACREAPGNFLKTLVANTLTSIGDRIGGAKTTLPWMLSSAGAPGWMISLLVPIRESGSMLPQMALGVWIRRRPIRKTIWAGGSVVQGLSLLGIGWAGTTLQGSQAGAVVLLLLVLFSLARGACSVVYKDVLGKTIPKSRRGRLSGWIVSVAGAGAMGTGLLLGLLSEEESPATLFTLLAAGALLWFLAALVYARIVEFPGETDGRGNGVGEAFSKWRLLVDDVPFRRFVVARALAMGSGLAAPYYVTMARDDLGPALAALGVFIAMEGLAGLVSAPIWGRWADQSSRLVFVVASALAAGTTLAVVLFSWVEWTSQAGFWIYPLLFFLLGTAHAGVRLGRKTYLVDMAEGNRRTDYVAVGNTAMGLLLLVAGSLGALASLLSVQAALLLLAGAGMLASLLGLRWKEVSASTT